MSAPASRLLPKDSFERIQWALELAAHWQWVYASAGAVCFILLIFLKRALWSLIPACLLSLSFAVQSSALDRSTEEFIADAVLAVGTENINFETVDFRPLINWLLSDRAPDVVFLQEFTDLAKQALETPNIAERYPNRVFAPQSDQFGLAILSCHQLTDVVKIEPSEIRETLRLRAILKFSGNTIVRISALHPMPPLNASLAQIRDQMLIEESQLLSQSGGLGLISGDFNTTSWARGMFAMDAKFRRAGGPTASWPNIYGLSFLPLDHILATRDWQLINSERGPDLGSDHRPVLVRLVRQHTVCCEQMQKHLTYQRWGTCLSNRHSKASLA